MRPKKKISPPSAKDLEKVAKDLNIGPPKSRESLGVRIIAYVMILGGLSIIGSVFVGIFEPTHTYNTYTGTLLRIGVGGAIIVIAYGVLKRRRWSLWGMAGLVAFSAFSNATLSLFLGGAFVFLLLHRAHFTGRTQFLLVPLIALAYFTSPQLLILLLAVSGYVFYSTQRR